MDAAADYNFVSHTRFKKDKFTVQGQWKVDKFMSLPTENEHYEEIEWNIPEKNVKLGVQVCGYDLATKSVALSLMNRIDRDLRINTLESNILVNGRAVLERLAVIDEIEEITAEPDKGWGFDLLERSELEKNPDKYLEDGSMIFFIRAEIEETSEKKVDMTRRIPNSGPKKENEKRFFEALKFQYENGLENTDVELICGDQAIECHKIILGSHSDVFQRMFHGDTEENRTGKVSIEDVEFGILQALVRFFYTEICFRRFRKRLRVGREAHHLSEQIQRRRPESRMPGVPRRATLRRQRRGAARAGAHARGGAAQRVQLGFCHQEQEGGLGNRRVC